MAPNERITVFKQCSDENIHLIIRYKVRVDRMQLNLQTGGFCRCGVRTPRSTMKSSKVLSTFIIIIRPVIEKSNDFSDAITR